MNIYVQDCVWIYITLMLSVYVGEQFLGHVEWWLVSSV